MFGKWQFTSINATRGLGSLSLRTRIILFVILAAALVAAILVAPLSQQAASPASGTIDPTMGVTSLSFTGGPYTQPNVSPVSQVDSGPRCNANSNPCDSFALSVTLPAGYIAAHKNPAVKVAMSWIDGGSAKSDYDLWIYNGTVGTLSGSNPGSSHSATSNDPEIASIFPLAEGTSVYTIKIVPFTPTGETVRVNIQLVDGIPTIPTPGPCDSLIFGGADKTCAGNPRYQNFYAPAGTSAESSRGEFNIGFDPITHRIMTMNAGPIWRLTPGEVQSPTKPECCEALWEDKSTPVLDNPSALDPILWTDQKTGRTFGSNSTAGANADYAYTDAAAPFSDGDQWVPVGISPPNGGVDHQTIGSGPYPLVAGLPNPLANPGNQGEMVLYTSQNTVGSQTQRSDDLGISYGPAVPSTGPGVMSSQGCGGLHGHLHVAPDGTAWLPDNSCSSFKQGGSISTDAGVTWNEFLVQKLLPDLDGPPFAAFSQTDGADPSVGIDRASTAYYCYVNNENNGTEGHVHVAVGKRMGPIISWIRDVDVGASHGIINAALTEAVGGSAGRAACGFVGTNVSGNYQLGTFTGVWYPYIATTYDEGRTWVTVNAAPNDPVQNHTGIWQQGGSGQNGDRNLLDFNEITVDDKGRVLYGYSDGCHSLACLTGDNSRGERGGFMRVARQSGGKNLFATMDPVEPALPKPPCLSGFRDFSGSHLTWKAPDNSGSDITGYQILRSTTMGGEAVLIANTGNDKTTYNDTTALASVPHYFYEVKAINTPGLGPLSNEADLAQPPPFAFDDVAVTPENQAVIINVLANDFDGGSPPITVTAVSTPGHGAANINGNSTVTYTPAASFFGLDSFTYTIRNGQLITATGTVRITVNPLCALVGIGSFSDTLEPAPQPGWTMNTAINNIPASPTWSAITDPQANSASHSFFSDASTLDLKDDRLVAPPQKLSSTTHLIFWHRFQYEDGYDGGVLEVSSDGGATWIDVLAGGGSFVSGGYNGSVNPSFGSPIAGRPAWTGGDATAAMTKVEVNLGAFAGLDRLVRFRLTTDPFAAGSTPGVGWFVDDVQFTNTLVERCPFNYALSLNGALAVASSLHFSGLYPAAAAINGDRKGNGWGTANGGWNDGTRGAYPDMLEADFGGAPKVIDEIRVFTLQNNWKTAGEPDLNTPATGEGILDFDVQYLNGSTWTTVPGGSVTGNDKAMRVFTFPAVTTNKVRVVVNNSRNNYSRIVELEAFGFSGQP